MNTSKFKNDQTANGESSIKASINDFFQDFDLIGFIKESNKIITTYESLPPQEQEKVRTELKNTPLSYFLS